MTTNVSHGSACQSGNETQAAGERMDEYWARLAKPISECDLVDFTSGQSRSSTSRRVQRVIGLACWVCDCYVSAGSSRCRG